MHPWKLISSWTTIGEILDDRDKYRRLMCKLNYLTVTRPDIVFVVSVVGQFLSTSRITHCDAVT